MKKLGHVVATSSVKRVMAAHDLHPSPSKSGPTPPMPWTQFVHAHMDSMVATDFFTKPIYTLFGRFESYVLVFIHLGSRKVYCSRPTKNPDSEWVMQQARNASMWLAEEGVNPKYLIRDGDRKFPDAFKEFWKAEDVRVIRIPPQSPRANAFYECFVGTIKKECLNFFMCFSLDQLHYITQVWLRHYNSLRPHRGINMNNNVLDEQFKPQREGPVRCREKLGGLSRVGTKGRPFVPPSEPDVRVSPHPAQASHQELVLTPGFFTFSKAWTCRWQAGCSS
jgi:putative transposase